MTNLKEWREQYYPVSASELCDSDASVLELVQHSLRKWEGLYKTVLEEHGLVKLSNAGLVIDPESGEQFTTSDQTCALCVAYLDQHASDASACKNCPLCKARGGTSCDSKRNDEQASPYNEWVRRDDPEPMILWLQKAEQETWSGRERGSDNNAGS